MLLSIVHLFNGGGARVTVGGFIIDQNVLVYRTHLHLPAVVTLLFMAVSIASVSVERAHLKQYVRIPHHEGLGVAHIANPKEGAIIVLLPFVFGLPL